MANDSGFKSCPFCAEQIREEAIKCRFCGEWLGTKLVISEPPPRQEGSHRHVPALPDNGTLDLPTVVSPPPSAVPSDAATDSKPPPPIPPRQIAGSEGALLGKIDLRADVQLDGGALVGPEAVPPVIASTPSNKWSCLFTPRVLNSVGCGLLALSVITIAVVVHGTQFNPLAADNEQQLAEGILKMLIGLCVFAWLSWKVGKRYGLVMFSLLCTGMVLVFVYYFNVARESAKQRNRQWAENVLDLYTNMIEFVQRGGTGIVPQTRFIGEANDPFTLFIRDFMLGIGTRFARINEEIDALAKREVFEDAVLTNKSAIADEIRKRRDSLKVLENSRGRLASLAEECKSKLALRPLNEDQRRQTLQMIENGLRTLEPKYNSVLNALARKEEADQEFLSFLVGTFADYQVKDGKIVFANEGDSAKYQALVKQVTDASAELATLVNRLMNEAEVGKSKVRGVGGIDGGMSR